MIDSCLEEGVNRLEGGKTPAFDIIFKIEKLTVLVLVTQFFDI